jgi:Sulfotransferase family
LSDIALRPPVFLSGLWRSGSTYVWSRFRSDPTAYCYYEPLHHGLARLTDRRIGRDTSPKIAAMRHPSLTEPYYAEYRPLLAPLRGVRGYSKDLAYERWTLDPAEPHPRLGRYVDGLIGQARALGRQPVLGCVRAVGRLGWMGRHRPDMALIHLDRAPLDVWRSCMEQARRGNATFMTAWLNVVWRNARHPLMAPLAARLPWRTGLFEALRKAKHRHHDMLDRMAMEESFFMIAYVWAAAALHGLSHAHAVIDVNRSPEPGYNADLARRLGVLTGARLDFSDMRIVAPPIMVDPQRREVLEREAVAMLSRHAPGGLFDPARVRARLAELSEDKARLLAPVVDGSPLSLAGRRARGSGIAAA